MKLNQRADFGWGEIEYHFINTGVPHLVVFVPDAETGRGGRARARHPLQHHFSARGPTSISSRSPTRRSSSSAPTSGASRGRRLPAARESSPPRSWPHRVHGLALPLGVKVRGGDLLTIDARDEGDAFANVTLAGPATEVFSARSSSDAVTALCYAGGSSLIRRTQSLTGGILDPVVAPYAVTPIGAMR